MTKEKKILIAIIVLGICLIGTYFIIDFSKDDNNNQQGNNGNATEKNNLELIGYDAFIEKKDNNEEFILVVTQTGCGACEAFKPTINEVLVENNIIAYEINLRELTSEQLEKFGQEFPIEYTPTTLIFKEGVEQTALSVVGNYSKEEITSTLKQYELID